MGLSEFCFGKMIENLDKRKPTAPMEGEPIRKEEGELFNFVVFGDPQVSNYMFARELCFYSACRDIKRADEKIDALVLVGDISENGMKCEYHMVAEILNGISDKIGNFFFVSGNHDIRLRPFRAQLKRFGKFASNVKNGPDIPGDRYWYSKDFDACRFIIMGADRNSFEAAHISRKQIEWLDREIASAEKEGKPAFVFNHQCIKNTHGLPDAWLGKGNWRGHIGLQSDKVRAVFEKHGNVIFVTGHLHYGTYENSYQDCGKFKSISVQTVGAGNHGPYSPLSQGYVISVFKDKIIARARLFADGKYVDKDIPNSEIIINIKGEKS